MSLLPALLVYCRAGFEPECAAEITSASKSLLVSSHFAVGQGYLVFTCKHPYEQLPKDVKEALSWQRLVFARQVLPCILQIARLPDVHRAEVIAAALELAHRKGLGPKAFATVWGEYPDTNDGKSLKKFSEGLGMALFNDAKARGLISKPTAEEPLPRLHMFLPTGNEAVLAWSYPKQGAPWRMGIPRLRMPYDAPSRATLKLEEAFKTFLTDEQAAIKLRAGSEAVDLGAAPGGWTYQLVKKNLQVTAVDNGPMDAKLLATGLVDHRREDAFKYRPLDPVEWMVCDLVDQPSKVIKLVRTWAENCWAKNMIFNLKLPMKRRFEEVAHCLANLDHLKSDWEIKAKQLYHDRKEVTVYLGKR